MCMYFYIGFIDFVFRGKTLFEYANFFLLMIMKRIKNNTKVFSIIKKMKKLYCII